MDFLAPPIYSTNYVPSHFGIFLGAQRPTAPGGTCVVPYGRVKVEYRL